MSVHPQARRPVTFRVNPDIKKRLDRLSEQTNRPVSFYINAILEEYFDEYEHAYFIKSEAEEIRAGRAMSYSINSVKTELGITVWFLILTVVS